MIEASAGSTLLRKLVAGPALTSVTGPAGRDGSVSGRAHHERALQTAIDRFELISRLDELWNADIAAGRLAYDEGEEREITALYRRWLDAAEQVAVTPLEDADPALGERFSRILQDARGICTPDEAFFAGPELIELRDQALRDYHAGETVEMREMGD